MSKINIDYSNTIIYKITCNDSHINDTYVGHTTNFVQRKYAHKQSCANIRSTNYKCKLYETIRNNGGWVNWKMEIINFFNCANQYEARKKEQEYFLLLNANLNSIEPFPPQKPSPIKTSKHVNVNYYCENCDFKCSYISDWNRHLSSRKHIVAISATILAGNNESKFKCVCGNDYKHKSSYYKHKKNCSQKHSENIIDNSFVPTTTAPSLFDQNIILELLKQNQEFKILIIEQNKTIIDLATKAGNTTNNTI